MDHRAGALWTACRGRIVLATACMLASVGCGTMKSHSATEQLLLSDAVDRTVSQIDFSPLSGTKVFLDSAFLRKVGGVGSVNSDYVISSLRERMLAARCILQDDRNNADYIAEVRVGALGMDGHEVNYGLPGSRALSTTAAWFTSAPLVPSVPEISLAKKDELRAAAKLAVYAFHRETMEPVGPSTVVKGESRAKSTWVLGAGPFQRGTIYDETQFAGAPLDVPEIPLAHIAKKPTWPRWLRFPWSNDAADTELAQRPPQLLPPSDVARQPPAEPPPQEGQEESPAAVGDSRGSAAPGLIKS